MSGGWQCLPLPLINMKNQTSFFLTIDCEFSQSTTVRELALLLFKGKELIAALEVLVSPSGASSSTYTSNQINYHVSTPASLASLTNDFLSHCETFSPLSSVSLVGVSLEQDIRILHKESTRPTRLIELGKIVDLQLCGKGTLKNKTEDNDLSEKKLRNLLRSFCSRESLFYYRFHTALFDAFATGYVFMRLIDPLIDISVSKELNASRHIFFKAYRSDLTKEKQQKKRAEKNNSLYIPKNFPPMNYKLQKSVSSVFDVVPRHLFHEYYAQSKQEMSAWEAQKEKIKIAQQCHLIKQKLKAFNGESKRTDPYNICLIEAGVALAKGNISIDTFIDFAIYIQQYNLPTHLGTYYKVSNNHREIFVRCLDSDTAKKMFFKKTFCTIHQFLNKKVPNVKIDVLQFPQITQ